MVWSYRHILVKGLCVNGSFIPLNEELVLNWLKSYDLSLTSFNFTNANQGFNFNNTDDDDEIDFNDFGHYDNQQTIQLNDDNDDDLSYNDEEEEDSNPNDIYKLRVF